MLQTFCNVANEELDPELPQEPHGAGILKEEPEPEPKGAGGCKARE